MASALRTNRRVGTAAAIGAAGLALALAGCSSSPSASPPTTTTKASTATTKPGTKTSVVTTVPASTTTIPYVPAKNARKDVTTTGSCVEFGGLWVLNGEIKNSASVARTYQIVVDYVTDPGDTVLNTQILNTKSVKPGASLAWVTKSEPGLTHVSCVIRQVQAPAP